MSRGLGDVYKRQVIQLRREVIQSFQLLAVEDIVDSEQSLEIAEGVHVTVAAGLETIFQTVAFHGVVGI